MANGINTVSDPCLIYCFWIFPEIGVTGAAVATNFGGSIGVLYGPYHRVGAMGRLQLGQQDIAGRLKIFGSLVQISAGGVVQFLVATASCVFLMSIVSGFGSDAVAGYTISVRALMFSILPAWGLSNAAATLVG